MRPVEVYKYNTPTADNRDCSFSIGVINLTEREAEVIAQFARGIRIVTSDRARGLTATQMRERQGLATRFFEEDKTRADALRAAYAADLALPPEERKLYLTGDSRSILRRRTEQMRERIKARKAAEKEAERPEEPRNRFSGLDIE